MIYFISAWYDQDKWRERENAWYFRKEEEFDDTIKQVQFFSRNRLFPYRIILLSYAPNFRHFLHRQSIFRADYWSVFDQIQCIKTKTQRNLSIYQLPWPDDVEFIESVFAVIVRRNGKKYAIIDFAEDGNLLFIRYFENESIIKKEYYDDRGFLSMIENYENGKCVNEEYLDQNGICKFTRFLEDGHVEINPENNTYLGINKPKEFEHLSYPSIDKLIEEVLKKYIKRTEDNDIFCVAMHTLHTDLLAKLLRRKKTILSFFEHRRGLEKNGVTASFLGEANYIVTDTKENERAIQEIMDCKYKNITNITPYDSRVDHGNSLEYQFQNILVMGDGLTAEVLEETLNELDLYAKLNHKSRAQIMTRSTDYQQINHLEKMIQAHNANLMTYVNGNISKKDVSVVDDNDLTYIKELEETPYFSVVQCKDAMDVNRKIKGARIWIDLQPVPDQFLQISALSLGIPQITLVETQYVKNDRNGRILLQICELNDWLAYYIENLANWNNARIESYEMGSEFSSAEIKKQWIQVIEKVLED